MARRRIKSRPGLFGMTYYYDEKGTPIGKSRPGLLEGTRVYTDLQGNYVGKSRPGILAKEVYMDAEQNQITSYEGLLGDVHYQNGVPIGHTSPGFFDSAYTTLEENEEISQEEDPWFDETEDEEEDSAEMEEKNLSDPPAEHIIRNILLFLACFVVCAVVLLSLS